MCDTCVTGVAYVWDVPFGTDMRHTWETMGSAHSRGDGNMAHVSHTYPTLCLQQRSELGIDPNRDFPFDQNPGSCMEVSSRRSPVGSEQGKEGTRCEQSPCGKGERFEEDASRERAGRRRFEGVSDCSPRREFIRLMPFAM